MDVFDPEDTVEPHRASESSVYLEIIHAPRVLRAKTFEQMQSSLSNDNVYALLRLFEETLGVPYREKDPSDWERLRALIVTLSVVVDVLNCQIEVLQVKYQRDTRRFANWDQLREFMIGAGHSSDPLLPGVMLYLRQALQNAQSVYGINVPGPYRLRDIVELHVLPVPAEYFANETFDAFVSYKTRKYVGEAESLCKLLAENGLRCWLDREQIRLRAGELMEKQELQAILRAALRASRITVFFETYAEATADEDERGRHLAFNWQIFEHRHAKRLLYIRPQRRVIDIPGTHSSETYVDALDLARKVAALADASRDAAPQTRLRGSSHHDLHLAVQEIRALTRDYLSCPVALSSRMSLIMLAPELIDEFGMRSIAMGDAVLVNLVRFSPFASLLLQRNGIDVAKLLHIAGEVDTELWSPPNDYRAPDLFGHDALSRSRAGQSLVRSELLDEVSLLWGILQFAAEAGKSFPGQLFLRTIQYMRCGENEADRNSYLRTVCERVAAAAMEGFRPEPTQQWILGRHKNSIIARPFAECGLYQLVDSPDSAGPAFTVNALQSEWLLESHALEDLDSSLTSGGIRESTEEVLSRYPVLQLMLSDIESLHPVICFSPYSADGTLGELFVLAPSNESHLDTDTRSGTGARGISALLAQALTLLVPGAQGECSFAGRPCQRAVVLGPAKWQRTGAPSPVSSFFDLHCNVLTPLWRISALGRLSRDGI